MAGLLGKYGDGVMSTYAPGANEPATMSSAAGIVCVRRCSTPLYNVWAMQIQPDFCSMYPPD